ncbi:MAG: hypothetical protein WD066_03310 [Planctomycetaceae bacterium]
MFTKTADTKGRIALGSRFAGKTFIVREVEGKIMIEPAVVIPEREAWLYADKQALESLRRGLEQARTGDFAQPPDLEADEALVAELED